MENYLSRTSSSDLIALYFNSVSYSSYFNIFLLSLLRSSATNSSSPYPQFHSIPFDPSRGRVPRPPTTFSSAQTTGKTSYNSWVSSHLFIPILDLIFCLHFAVASKHPVRISENVSASVDNWNGAE